MYYPDSIKVPGFHDQYLNASGQSNKDGTPLITWYSENKWRKTDAPDYPHNAQFNFYMVHGVNSNMPAVATKLTHGRNLLSYPAKTAYKTGSGNKRRHWQWPVNDCGGILYYRDWRFHRSGDHKAPVTKKDELANPRLSAGFRIEAFPRKTSFKAGESLTSPV